LHVSDYDQQAIKTNLYGFVPMVLTGLTNVVIGHEWVIRSARSDPYEI